MEEQLFFNTYSNYLKNKYSEKVYKLPINLPISCPNRMDGDGCTFCSEKGTGFESLDSSQTVKSQLEQNKAYIAKKYKAKKFIAYFQNFTNTFMPLDLFCQVIKEAAEVQDIVEISISTRPDCVTADYLQALRKVKQAYGIQITIELGLQTANYHTLDKIKRGHGIAEFIGCVLLIQRYKFTVCTHVILNLPYDTKRDTIETAKLISVLPVHIVKLHSLYIAKNTELCEAFEHGKIKICSKEEYFRRLRLFLEHLRSDMIVERLFGRAPQEEVVFSNWNTSWWKLKNEFLSYMGKMKSYQGCCCGYLEGAAIKRYLPHAFEGGLE